MKGRGEDESALHGGRQEQSTSFSPSYIPLSLYRDIYHETLLTIHVVIFVAYIF